jgi:hypothetical protein
MRLALLAITMRKTAGTTGTAAPASQPLEAGVVAVNAAVVAFVDELLRLPSRQSARTVVQLLYGGTFEALPAVLTHVNGGIHIPLASLLASRTPLATLLPQRLRVTSAWKAAGQEMKGARAAARSRYRELQTSFVAAARTAAPEPAASLVRYTYGAEGQRWVWADAAARVMHRIVGLNRAVLDVLAAGARAGRACPIPMDGEVPSAPDFDLPDPVLDLMAATLPPVAVPDWSRFAPALAGSQAPMYGEESTIRYQSLLAEILGLQSHSETLA